MPWYWILIILSAIIGPFEAMHALNKARRNREEAEKRRREANSRTENDIEKAKTEDNPDRASKGD